jgi:acylphosphatase
MKTLRIKIKGVVQGVFFRKFVKENADELGIRGFVRNLEDSRIELIIEGKDEKVNELLARCKKGPKHSEIKEIEVEEIKHQGFNDFKISVL